MSPERAMRVGPIGYSLVLVTLVGAVLRLYHLGFKSLWYDEAVIYQVAQGGWREIVAANAALNSAPPLYPLLLGLMTAPEASEATLRALSMVAGTAAIPLTWLLARQFAGGGFALLAAFLVALSPVQIAYSQELREYSLAYTLAAAMAWFMARFASAPVRRDALLIGALAFVSLGMQYGLALFIAGLDLACIAHFYRTRRPVSSYLLLILPQLAAAVVAGFLYGTAVQDQIAVLGGFRREGYLWDRYWDGTWSGLGTLLATPGRGFLPSSDLVGWAFPGKVMLALCIVGAFAFLLDRRSWLATGLFFLPLAVLIAAALMRLYPFGAIRQDIAFLPMIYVAAARGVACIWQWLQARYAAIVPIVGMTCIIVALAFAGLPDALWHLQRPSEQEMRSLVADLQAKWAPGEAIYVYWAAAAAFEYYWRVDGVSYRVGPSPWSVEQPVGIPDEHVDSAAGQIQAMLETSGTAWLVVSQIRPAHRERLLAAVTSYGTIDRVLQSTGTAAFRITSQPRINDRAK